VNRLIPSVFRSSATVLLLLAILSPAAFGIEFSLRLSGGLHSGSYKDINDEIADWEEYQRLDALANPDWVFGGAKTLAFHAGSEFEAEFVLTFSRRLAAGFSAGLIYAEMTEDESALSVQKYGTDYLLAHATKVAAYPCSLTVHYAFPISQKIEFYVKGGVGLIFVNYTQREGSRRAADASYAYTLSQTVTGNGLFVQTGLGWSFQFDPRLGFFVEAGGRLANISGLSGDLSPTVEGKLYNYQEYDARLDFWQTKLRLSMLEPSGETIRLVRRAAVNLSGVFLRAGLRLRF
jgi:hypothetical protein